MPATAETAPIIDFDRLSQITALDSGSHDDLDDGACVMEAVAYVAREPWSDPSAMRLSGDRGVPAILE